MYNSLPNNTVSEWVGKGILCAFILVLVTASPARAHEPIFGVGPRPIWMHGFGFELGLNAQEHTRDMLYELDYHAVYGLTADWAVLLETHQALNSHGHHSPGFGNLGVRTKYRFYRNDVFGGVYHASVLGKVDLPTGNGPNTTDVAAGLSGAYEGRRWLAYTTARYRLNSKLNNVQRGDVFLYDVALGIRPVKTDYYDPDVVLMAELNGQIFGANEINGQTVEATSGDRLFAGFGTWITWRNWAFKPGVQIPVYDNVGRESPDLQYVLGIEFHI